MVEHLCARLCLFPSVSSAWRQVTSSSLVRFRSEVYPQMPSWLGTSLPQVPAGLNGVVL